MFVVSNSGEKIPWQSFCKNTLSVCTEEDHDEARVLMDMDLSEVSTDSLISLVKKLPGNCIGQALSLFLLEKRS